MSIEQGLNLPVYLDYAATTPVDPSVASEMMACLTSDGIFGNPASRSHLYGWKAEEVVESARQHLSSLIGADPREIVWTSGATEADNLAVKGVAGFHRDRGRHIITSRIEHKAVLDSCKALEREGFKVSYLEPDENGRISAEKVEAEISADTILVTIMHANNEIGSVNDIAAIGQVCRRRQVLYHVDAAQSVGKIPIDLSALPVDLMSIAAHKFYGPKGVGALFVRRQPPVRLTALIDGGGHERGMRSGTLATHQIVGLGEAARLAEANMGDEHKRLSALRERFWQGVSELGGLRINGDPDGLPGILNISFAGVDGEPLLLAMKDLAVSTGSACTSASLEPSYVLRAIGLVDELAHSSIRFSFGRFTTREEIDFAVASICEAVSRLRQPGHVGQPTRA